MSEPILNIAAYKFVALDALAELRAQLRELCRSLDLRGTILLAPEGINLFLAGSGASIEAFLRQLRARTQFGDLAVKRSFSDTQPFGKLLVKLKKEIISLGRPDIDPVGHPAPRLSAAELKRWLDEGRDVILFDTRNTFEVEHGTFRGARHIGLGNFRSFGQRVHEIDPAFRDKPVVTFCTGGIRCEKAAPLLIREGFREVYQLDGGILKYFEECGSSHFDGSCYVFDERVALDAALAPRE
jgi:predicted sulfurtransferase